MNSYRMSCGKRINKDKIDRLIRSAKAQVLINQVDEFGYNFCEECKKSGGTYLDCSHTVSVDKCQKEGATELAWDINNIRILCRKCHRQHDKL